MGACGAKGLVSCILISPRFGHARRDAKASRIPRAVRGVYRHVSMPFIWVGVNAGRYERQRSTTEWSTSAVNIW